MSTSYTLESLKKLRKQQSAAFNIATPGEWFDQVSTAISSLSADTPVCTLGIQNGKHLGFNAQGEVVMTYKSRTEIDEDENETTHQVEEGQANYPWRGFNEDIGSLFVPGCAPCISEVEGVRYASGITVVAGRGNTGKTPFCHALAAHIAPEGYEVVRFGEPLSGYHSNFDDFIADLGRALVTKKVIVIDSMKDIIAAAGGTTTTGGLSRGAFQLMSDIGIISASRGNSVIVSLNPTSDDARVIELVNEAVRSNATTLASSSDGGSSWDIITRTGEGLVRVGHSLRASYTDMVMSVTEQHAMASGDKKKVSSSNVQNEVSEAELESALKRISHF
jgi:hypothetical protein